MICSKQNTHPSRAKKHTQTHKCALAHTKQIRMQHESPMPDRLENETFQSGHVRCDTQTNRTKSSCVSQFYSLAGWWCVGVWMCERRAGKRECPELGWFPVFHKRSPTVADSMAVRTQDIVWALAIRALPLRKFRWFVLSTRTEQKWSLADLTVLISYIKWMRTIFQGK